MFSHAWDKFQIFSKIFSKTFPEIFQYIPKIELVTREGQVNGWFQNQQKPKLLEAARSDIGITAARDVRPNKYILQKIISENYLGKTSPWVEGRIPSYSSKVIPKPVRRAPVLRPTAIGQVKWPI